MTDRIRIRRTATAGKVPTTLDLQEGELGLNTIDKKLYSSDGTSVFEIGNTIKSYSSLNTDITSLISGTTSGNLFEGITSGHFVIGIKGDDAQDGFHILDKGNASNSNTNPYLNRLFSVSRSLGVSTTLPVSAPSFSGNGALLTNLNASNISTGTVNVARIPTGTTETTVALGNHNHAYLPLAGGTLTGALGLPSSVGTFEIKAGTGDGAGFTLYNTTIKSHYGIGFRDYSDNSTVKAFIDCRSGNIGSSGTISATSFSGSGASLTSLNASNIASGIVNIAHIPTGATSTTVSLGNHTHAYLPLAGGTLTGELGINNTAPTITLQDTDQNSAFIHVNSNQFYILRGGVNATTWTQVGGVWPLQIDLTNNNAIFGGSVSATSFSGSGASLTALNASNLTSGTVADARLSSNVVLLTGTQTISGAKTFSNGIIQGSTPYPTYEATVEFGADAANTWRRIINVISSTGLYATIGFKIEVTDAKSNQAGILTVDNIITETYYVACVRTETDVQDTPDACYVRGPGNRIRATKTATGTYQIQIQNEVQYREYIVRISVYASNGNHTVTYHAGDTATAGIAQYNATVSGTSREIFQNITTRQLTSNIATGTAPFVVTSTTEVTNLNADLLDGQQGSYYLNASNLASGTVPDARISGIYSNITGLVRTGTTGSFVLTSGTGTPGSGAVIQLFGSTHGTNAGQSFLDTSIFNLRSLDGTVAYLTVNSSEVNILGRPLVLTAGTTTIQPLRLQTGVNLTTPVFGSVEFDGTNLYLTNNSTTPARKTIAYIDSNITGSASRITTARNIAITGDATWNVNFDGSANVTAALTLANSGVTAGTYTKLTVDVKGRVTVGGTLYTGDIPSLDAAKITTGTFDIARIPNLDWSKITTGKPTTIAGYGITNAYTKTEVDTLVTGLDFKNSVKAASNGNLTLSGAQTVDGIALIAGDRILVKNQTTGSQNGIYVVAAGAWARSTDSDNTTEINSGMYTFVEQGTVNADSGWVLTTDNPITLETTALTFTQFNGLGQIIAGNGLTKTGNQLDVIGTAGRIVANADSIDLATAGTAGTYPKVTTDAYGRVTAGTTLAATDIPNLDTAKITTGTFDIARIPTGTTSTTVALGNHTHSFLPLTGGTLTGNLSITGSLIGTGAGVGMYETSLLGTVAGNTQLLWSKTGVVHNIASERTWIRRRVAGTDWQTASFHNGITVDASFLTPGVDTRAWWERDIGTGSQSWGNSNTTFFSVGSSTFNIPLTTQSTSTTTGALIVSGGVGVAGSINAGAGITAGTNLTVANQGELRLSELTANGTNYVALRSPANVAANITLTLPATLGANGQVLVADASGNLSWINNSADNLGNHTATTTLNMNGQSITNASSFYLSNNNFSITNNGSYTNISLGNTANSEYGVSSIEIPTHTTYGGTNTHHTGVKLASGGMSGWGTAQFQVYTSTDWKTYSAIPCFRVTNNTATVSSGILNGLSSTFGSSSIELGYNSTISFIDFHSNSTSAATDFEARIACTGYTGGTGGGDLGIQSNNLTLTASMTNINSDCRVSNNLSFQSVNGVGIRWFNDDRFKLYTSYSTDATFGGRLDTTSDWNMYFKVTLGTNRGFVFMNSTTPVAQIDGGGRLYIAGSISTINNITPQNGAISLSPNLHLNSGNGLASNVHNAVIINWSNVTPTNTSQPTLLVANGAAVELMRVNYNGNVGIGTGAPAAKLHVSTNSTEGTIQLGGTATTGYYSQIYQNSNNLDIIANGDQAHRVILGTNNGTGNIRFFTASGGVGNTERMRIAAAGDVGIGTTSPIARLTIWGDNTTDEGQMIRLGSSSTTDFRIFRSRATGTLNFDGTQTTYSSFKFSTTAASDALNILNNGNVGIGTTTPVASLHMYQDRYTLYGPNSTWGAYLQVGGNGRVTSYASVATSSGNLHIDAADGGFATYINWYSQNNTFINAQAGNVGIGTSGPSQKLDVAGNINLSGAILMNGSTVIDANGGWHRTYGATGWYNSTYEGGMYMTNTTWVRTYNGKSLWSEGNLGVAGSITHINGFGPANGAIRLTPNLLLNAGASYAVYVNWDNGNGIGTAVENPSFVVGNGLSSNRLFTVTYGGQLIVPGVYNTTVGATNRDVYVDNAGKVGYLSSIYISKTNIKNIINTDWLLKLRPVIFQFRERDEKNNYLETYEEPIQYGLIAEEVEEINPDLCFYDEIEGKQELRGINYSKLITPMLKLLQEQQDQIDVLQTTVSILMKRLEHIII